MLRGDMFETCGVPTHHTVLTVVMITLLSPHPTLSEFEVRPAKLSWWFPLTRGSGYTGETVDGWPAWN